MRETPGAFLPDTAVVLVASILIGWLSYAVIERSTGQLAGMFGSDGRLVSSARRTGGASDLERLQRSDGI